MLECMSLWMFNCLSVGDSEKKQKASDLQVGHIYSFTFWWSKQKSEKWVGMGGGR